MLTQNATRTASIRSALPASPATSISRGEAAAITQNPKTIRSLGTPAGRAGAAAVARLTAAYVPQPQHAAVGVNSSSANEASTTQADIPVLQPQPQHAALGAHSSSNEASPLRAPISV